MAIDSVCWKSLPLRNIQCECFLEVNNGVSGNNIIRQGVLIAYHSIAEFIICNVKFKLRGLKLKRWPLVEILEVEVLICIN